VLNLREQVQSVCGKRGWEFEEVAGDLQLLRSWLNGDWAEKDFLVVPRGGTIAPRHDAGVISAEP